MSTLLRRYAVFTAILAASFALQAAPPDASSIGLAIGVPDAEAQRRSKKARKGKKAKKPGKEGKKQKKIKRHMFTAQYFLLQENDLEAAAEEYGKVLELDKGHVEAGLGIAYIHVRQKNPDKAKAQLDKMAKQKPKEPRIWHALGKVATEMGDHDAALVAYKGALRINRLDAEAHWLIYENLHKRYQKGDKELKKELSAAISSYLRYAGRKNGIRYKSVERAQIEITGDALALTMYDADIAYNAAFAETRLGQINQKMAKARSGYMECLRSQPRNQRCHYGMGRIHYSVKASDHYDRQKARSHFMKANKLPEAHIELAKMARFEDDLASARKSLEKALSLDKRHQRARVELGIVYKLDGNNRKAVKSFVEAYRVNRFSADGSRALAELTKIDPEHQVVKENSVWGIPPGDLFTSDRFRAAILRLEQALGGVDKRAPEQAGLEIMLGRLLAAADVDSSAAIKVAILRTPVPNALALPNGNIYFTRGMLDYIKKRWPDRPLDADNAVVAHILAHEIAHVIRRHTLQSNLYQEAIKNASRSMDHSILTHVTRLHEVEADRVGIVMAFLAGYHPRGGIEIMEARGQVSEIPKNLSHPTFDERVDFLEEYWSNDVKYGFVSFKLGVDAMRSGDQRLAVNAAKATGHYKDAIEHFTRFRETLKPTKAVLNNMAVAHAKLGLLAMAKKGSPLHRWQTELSIERESAAKYVAVAKRRTRGAPGGTAIPKDMRRAVSLLEDALKRDANYARARENLAAAYIATGKLDRAKTELGKIKPRGKAKARIAMMRGIFWAEKRKYNEAIREFRLAMQDPGLRNAGTYNLARLYVLAGDKGRAKQLYKRYLNAVPRGPWAQAARREMKGL